ncbi:hypothetical protein OZN62_00105 [Aurantiacibacter sp. MUD11]|uniref:COG3904 family protein n=1 Tax=Aurantiacibacter sp. MUD11 TaxID=3003265 RepID=UPI0022AAFF9A|nr:hypothetical protein [Aurantiacibacter sp. MUD11]WAT18017.1 hypothetical protein OZN62_00105 [Aurantiacibacter sp. MUD11]
MRRAARALLAIGACFALSAQSEVDSANPTCPAEPDWGPAERMVLSTRDAGDMRVLVAEGIIDATLPERLRAAIDADEMIGEVWIRSRGGDARAGNEAGRIIRSYALQTRIPTGWTCFSACNFMFMGGLARHVEPGGIFMVHMFTHTSDRSVISETVLDGTQATAELIGEIEQSSALLASEDNDFLIRMGVSRLLLTEVMYQVQAVESDRNPSTRYCLSDEEVLRYNVKTVVGEG